LEGATDKNLRIFVSMVGRRRTKRAAPDLVHLREGGKKEKLSRNTDLAWRKNGKKGHNQIGIKPTERLKGVRREIKKKGREDGDQEALLTDAIKKNREEEKRE